MTREQKKSENRRKKSSEAIAALGIPGVQSTRNLESWLIRERAAGNAVSVVVSWGDLTATYPAGIPAPAADTVRRFVPHPDGAVCSEKCGAGDLSADLHDLYCPVYRPF